MAGFMMNFQKIFRTGFLQKQLWYTNADMKISIYVPVHIKILP